MKKLLCVLVLCLFATPAFSFHLGPATPASSGDGEVNVGAGYFFYQGEWENLDIEQHRAYLHAGYLMGIEDEARWEIFVRGGAADAEFDDENIGNFDSNFKPFVATGVKGAFYDGRYFGWGLVLQGAYFASFSSNEFNVRNAWQIEGGLPFQVRLGPAIFYAGPVFFTNQAKLQNDEGLIDSRNVNEDSNFGGFGGIALDLGPLRLEAEAQYKSDFSGGGFVSIRF